MVQFTPFASLTYVFSQGYRPGRWVSPFGYLRIYARLAAPRRISQPSTSFIASCCQGIHHIHLKNYHAVYLVQDQSWFILPTTLYQLQMNKPFQVLINTLSGYLVQPENELANKPAREA